MYSTFFDTLLFLSMDTFSFSSSVTWLSVLQQKRRKAIVKYFENSVMEKGLLFLPYQCIFCGFIWMNCISKLWSYSSSTHMKILWQETKTPNWWPFKCAMLEQILWPLLDACRASWYLASIWHITQGDQAYVIWLNVWMLYWKPKFKEFSQFRHI